MDSCICSEGIRFLDGLLPRLTKRLVERAMDAELSEHLGYERGQAPPVGAGNACNGITPKTIHTTLTYKLQSWEFQRGEERTFWSYTGTYEESDRIVEGQANVYEVIRVERQATPLEHGVLLVQTIR